MSERAASPARRAPQAAPARGGQEPLLTIGEVLARLAPEFGEVTHSKVRFLEDRGLVSPQRTPSGYRKFSATDLERLRTVLRLQRDQYMPLRVIREHLASLDEGREPAPGAARAGEAPFAADAPDAPEAPAGPAAPEAPAAPGAPAAPAVATARAASPADRAEPVARADVLAGAGGSSALLEALEDHGLLPRESAGRYPRPALDLVRAAAVLGEHGIEPRHLRALRTAVGAEAALVEQVVSPLRRARPGDRPERAGERAEDAERVARELVGSLLALHAAALGCALDAVPPPT
ncbi:transcriptional regulator FtsR [Quadrisphaera sp. KR29]|uniref:transcriptional regulator FtsR n=1 Tax=Quadrisphaera sp. KR29 TaxID=3461391 RepID=UPI0040439888